MSTQALGRFDHIGIAVHSIEKARIFFEESLGARFRYLKEDPQGFRFAVFDLDGFTIELLDPIDPNGFIAKFLEKHGEGVHHITLQTPDLEAQVDRLESQGVRVVDKHLNNPEFIDAFISPRSGCGVLFQLGQTAPPLNNQPHWEK
jgi:methylmalonyl-CoA/ethylmalonyl-CoA epimerase